MSHNYEIYKGWEDHDGARVLIDGRAHKLRVNTYVARYPVEQRVMTVHAEPVNKRSKHYREVRAALGDDWSTDVLDSDCTVQAEVWAQLQEAA